MLLIHTGPFGQLGPTMAFSHWSSPSVAASLGVCICYNLEPMVTALTLVVKRQHDLSYWK